MKSKAPDPKIDEIELHPDGWERFERAVKAAARHPIAQKPKPKIAKQPKKATSGRA
jgi:hypothetical protein